MRNSTNSVARRTKLFGRTAHGTGSAALLRVEVPPPPELSDRTVTAPLTVPIQRNADGSFADKNTVSRGPRIRPGKRGTLVSLKEDPRYAPFSRWGSRYGAWRRRELTECHGGISAGVAGIVESAAQAQAGARFVQMLASESGDPELFKMAAALGAQARQAELTAWELSARENRGRAVNPEAWNEMLKQAALPRKRD